MGIRLLGIILNILFSYFALQIFDGNIISDYDAIYANWFDPPVVARFFRLITVDYFNRVRLRMELYGCKEGKKLICCNLTVKVTS